MILYKKKSNSNYILPLIFIIIVSILLRLHKINFDDFWLDEIITFWITDPSLTFAETYARHYSIDINSILFNIILKNFFKFFNYEIYIGRYLSFFFGILSFFSISYLFYLLKKNKAQFLFFLILLGFNSYFIKYSQELRLYSMWVFFISVTLIYFIKLTKKNDKIHACLFTLFQILSITTHVFAIIIYFSIIFYYLLSIFLDKEKNFKYIKISIIFIFIFNLFYLPLYISSTDLNLTTSWITLPELKFYRNFYFSIFFGSRITGAIYLLLLIFLVIKFRKKIFTFSSINLFFFILIILSYMAPLAYSYFIKPVLVHRYIIFIVIPILLIISDLTFKIKNIIIKNTTVLVLILLTIFPTMKDIIFIKSYSKPSLKSALEEINKSNTKEFTINFDIASKKSEFESIKFAYTNYFLKFIQEKNFQLKYIDFDKSSNYNSVWILCIADLSGFECTPPPSLKSNKKLIVLKELDVYKINLKLIKFI